MTTRWLRVVRGVALAVFLSSSGCVTALTWEAAPRVRAERLLGARVDDERRLEFGVELNDGRRIAYRQSRDGKNLINFMMEPIAGVDAGQVAWTCSPDEHGAVKLRPAPSIVSEAVDPELSVREGYAKLIVLDTGDPKTTQWVTLPEAGEIRGWHPGTWLCVVATPVTVAVDVVTFPVQYLLFLFLHPNG